MLILQAVPRDGKDIYKLLRTRIRFANTWEWGNKSRTRLRHVQRRLGGHIRIEKAGGVLVAFVQPKTPADLFYLAEKFAGRLAAWFTEDLAAINIQFVDEQAPKRRARRRKR
jgi:hypothetical protein